MPQSYVKWAVLPSGLVLKHLCLDLFLKTRCFYIHAKKRADVFDCVHNDFEIRRTLWHKPGLNIKNAENMQNYGKLRKPDPVKAICYATMQM